MLKVKGTILLNVNLKEKIFEMTIQCEKLANKAKAGQFINISTQDQSMLLKRPISICCVFNDCITITYRVVGSGTKALSLMKIGDTVEMLAPLGNGFQIVEGKKCLLIGGGIGIPPMVELMKQLKGKNNEIVVISSARSKDLLIYDDIFKQDSTFYITTDDGSSGFQGNVIQFLKSIHIDFDVLYACGPSKMLQGLDELYYGKKEGYISFEERMACGIGACYGCVCKTKTVEHGYMRVCKEGPVFPLGVIQYES